MNLQLSPLVSVGITTFNRPEGLFRTLKCISEQTYKNLEIIVGDNSTLGEETELIVKEFMKDDSRISYFHHSENFGGEYNARFVLNKSNGKYFMFATDIR